MLVMSPIVTCISTYRFQLALCGLLLALGAGVHAANQELELYDVEVRAPGYIGRLPDGKALRVLSLGFDRLIADLYWLRTANYMGNHESHEAGYPEAERLAELVTDIDPTFRAPYVLMSGALIALCGKADAAVRLLEKSVENISHWKLHFLLGFSYFIEQLDFARAAVQIQKAADLGDGPPYLPLLATRLYAKAGESDTALAFVRTRLAQVTDLTLRKQLEKRYWDLWITRDLAAIDAAITQYRAKYGDDPEQIASLLRDGLLASVPRDPKGGEYTITAGRARTELEFDSLEVHQTYRPTALEYQDEYERLRRQQEGTQ